MISHRPGQDLCSCASQILKNDRTTDVFTLHIVVARHRTVIIGIGNYPFSLTNCRTHTTQPEQCLNDNAVLISMTIELSVSGINCV
jgi:hypothetical protein